VKYGYATVGRVEAGAPGLAGRVVFALHPHQDVFTISSEAVRPVPDGVPPERAVLAANMETALNAVWDGAPGPGDRIAVVGAGVLGLLVARLCARIPSAEVTVVDIVPERAALARAVGARFAQPDEAAGECDLVFHACASAAGLATALALAGDETTVVELSWYGTGDVAVPLGEAFHSRRLTILSSQVGSIPPARRAEWTTRRRMALALDLLRDSALDVLITGESAFDDLPDIMARLATEPGDTLCHRIRY
jgi:threonine dehydrogenase-like Zn-dependent dehydrogenase